MVDFLFIWRFACFENDNETWEILKEMFPWRELLRVNRLQVSSCLKYKHDFITISFTIYRWNVLIFFAKKLGTASKFF